MVYIKKLNILKFVLYYHRRSKSRREFTPSEFLKTKNELLGNILNWNSLQEKFKKY